MPYTITPTNEDPFFFDREELQKIADEHTIRQGLAYFKEHRVMEIDHDAPDLYAQVEDERLELPVAVSIRLLVDGNLAFSCDCPEGEESVCRHQVAALYAYAEEREKSDALLTSMDTAIKERIKRGRAEVRVESLSGEPWFGTWRAASESPTTHFPRQYRVTVRSLHRRANFCSCPDFANNQLGTCKHIEAVLHKIRKHPEYRRFENEPVPFSYVYLAWDLEDAPRLRLHRAPTLAPELGTLFDSYFDAAGIFTGRLPDDFFRFVELIEERSDVHLGEDAA